MNTQVERERKRKWKRETLKAHMMELILWLVNVRMNESKI